MTRCGSTWARTFDKPRGEALRGHLRQGTTQDRDRQDSEIYFERSTDRDRSAVTAAGAYLRFPIFHFCQLVAPSSWLRADTLRRCNFLRKQWPSSTPSELARRSCFREGTSRSSTCRS